MKHSIAENAMIAVMNLFGLAIFKLDLHDLLNIAAFLVILVSNWSRFSVQIRKWIKKYKQTNAKNNKKNH